jgi:hypothetical protein
MDIFLVATKIDALKLLGKCTVYTTSKKIQRYKMNMPTAYSQIYK